MIKDNPLLKKLENNYIGAFNCQIINKNDDVVKVPVFKIDGDIVGSRTVV